MAAVDVLSDYMFQTSSSSRLIDIEGNDLVHWLQAFSVQPITAEHYFLTRD